MSDLRIIHSEVKTANTGKIIGAIVVALAVGAVGIYTIEIGMWNPQPQQAVPYKDLPSPGLPIATPAAPIVPPKS
jgi:hypothetical protein